VTVAIDVECSTVGIDGHEPDPAILDQLANERTLKAGLQHFSGVFSDDQQQPYRFVNLDHLPRKSGSEIARLTVHHPQ
jgi:hypothetical protein